MTSKQSAGGSQQRSTESKRLQKLLFIDGIHYSVLMVRLVHSRLCNDLFILSKDYYLTKRGGKQPLSKKDSFTLTVSALSNAWQIIDSMNRLRQLLSKAPDLKQNSTELQLFYRRTVDIEYFRNSIQHLNENIMQYVKNRIPSWGTLNWVAKLDDSKDFLLFSLIPGEIFDRATPLTNPINRKITTPIGLITLCLDKEICISDLVEKYLREIVNYLQASLYVNCSDIAQSMLLAMELTPQSPESPQEASPPLKPPNPTVIAGSARPSVIPAKAGIQSPPLKKGD